MSDGSSATGRTAQLGWNLMVGVISSTLIQLSDDPKVAAHIGVWSALLAGYTVVTLLDVARQGPLVIVALLCATGGFVVGHRVGNGTLSCDEGAPELCGAIRSALSSTPGAGPVRLLVKRVQFDHPNLWVTRAAERFALEAARAFGDKLTVISLLDHPTEAPKGGDLVLSGTAQAWDPDSSDPTRFRVLLTLDKHRAVGLTDKIHQWVTGAIPASARWPIIDVEASVEDPESIRGQTLSTTRGDTPLTQVCLDNPGRRCYLEEAIRASSELVRRAGGLVVSRVVVEKEHLLFASFDQFIAGSGR